MRDSHLPFRAVVLYFLQPYGRKRKPFEALDPGLAKPSRGSHETSASAAGGPSRFLDGALSDLRQAGVQMPEGSGMGRSGI